MITFIVCTYLVLGCAFAALISYYSNYVTPVWAGFIAVLFWPWVLHMSWKDMKRQQAEALEDE